MDSCELTKKVQKCETLEELSIVILEASEFNKKEEGILIQGLRQSFNASRMVDNCLSIKDHLILRALTRNYGIRQQACYILMSELLEQGKREKLLSLFIRS